MKLSKDPFEAAYEESPPESPIAATDNEPQMIAAPSAHDIDQEDYDVDIVDDINVASTSAAPLADARPTQPNNNKTKDDDEEEEEENMEVELGQPNRDLGKKPDMNGDVISRFTQEQTNRYESFRRSGFQKSNMKRLLVSLTGSQRISIPQTIVVSGIAKMFVGELIEMARVVMAERKDSGPIRPCHIRESYRRLKLEGKIPKRSVSRLFR